MHPDQQRHIDRVLQTVHGQGLAVSDPLIADSWRRSVWQYGHDPGTLQEARILSADSFRQHRHPFDEFIAITDHGLRALYQQIHSMGYVVLLADTNGVVVQAHGIEQQPQALQRAGLCCSAQWQEAVNGTSAVALALATGQAVTVHQNEHFDATHINLTCSAAPIYDSHGVLHAILNVSALRSDSVKASQYLVFQMVRRYAQLIENAVFVYTHKHNWQIKLSESAPFLEVDPDYLLAVDDEGRVCGANQRLRQWLMKHRLLPATGLDNSALVDLLGMDLQQLVSDNCADGRRKLRLGKTLLHAHILPPAAPLRISSKPEALPAPLARLCGPRSSLRRQLAKIGHLADTLVPILLNGETGSGKELLARAIHDSSSRSARPFVAVNCAAIAESLIESELYGYAPGSFSGASGKGKIGLIQAADGGTLFLDEIGDMPLFLQSRLLRVLSEREVLPVGSTRAIKIDIRVIAATHCDLQQRISEGKFREDLYYRLNGLRFIIPPLRARDDLPYLVERILDGCARQFACSGKPLSPDALALLRQQSWPGNLRQLKSVLEVALLTARGPVIDVCDLPEEWLHSSKPSRQQTAATPPLNAGQILNSPENLRQLLQMQQWRITAVAAQLGVSRMTLYRYLNKHGIRKPI